MYYGTEHEDMKNTPKDIEASKIRSQYRTAQAMLNQARRDMAANEAAITVALRVINFTKREAYSEGFDL